MSDDVDTIREFVAYLASRSKAMDAQDAVDSVEAALGRVVAERDELREYATKIEGERDGWVSAYGKCQLRVEAAEAERDELREYATKVEGERDGWIAQGDELRARLQQHEQTDSKEEANG